MAKVKYEVVAITGKYTNAAGEEKNRYLKIGVILQTDKGHSLKLESLPIGWDGWAMLSEPKPREAPQKPAAKPAAQSGSLADLENDIPFASNSIGDDPTLRRLYWGNDE